MAINTSLLVSAAMLQDYLVDKDTGLPLVAGTIELYKDNQRSVHKNWYMQQGTNPPYSYVALPNPMTLSAVGTMEDVSGNDVIPFYYPYDESATSPTVQTYYIVVKDADGEVQFTRSNFPFTPDISGSSTVATDENIITNSGFWRNIAPDIEVDTTNTGSILTSTIDINGIPMHYGAIAPSQHDGFTMPDICYFRSNISDGAETISFKTFTNSFADNVFQGKDPLPQYYLDIHCSNVTTESVKYIQIPLNSSLYALSGLTDDVFTLEAYNVISGTTAIITVGIFQYWGSGTSSPSVSQTSIPLTSSWNKYQTNLPIPSAQTVAESKSGDGGLYLQIGLPSGEFNIGLALPSFYLSETAPTNSFQTNDQVNAIISSPRTGDVRTSLNSFSPYGWVPANDGTIGNTDSAATTRHNVDTWQLYNLIYTQVDNGFAPVSGGRTSPGNTTAAALVDFIANKPMALTKVLGRVLIGAPTSSTVTYNHTSNLFTVADTTLYYQGSPVILTSSSGGTINAAFTFGTVYFVVPVSVTTFKLANTYALAIAGTAITPAGTNDSTPTVTISFAFGSYFGEYQHVQLETELALHHHNYILQSAGAGSGAPTGNGTPAPAASTTDTGSSAPFNIVQPSTYMNVFIKL